MEIFDPDLRIVDPHHHLYPDPAKEFAQADVLRDLASGHRVEATVVVESIVNYRQDGDPAFAPVGETEYMAGVLKSTTALGGPRVAAGIVGFVDFMLEPAVVGRVLADHLEAGEGAFRGVRHPSTWHERVKPGKRSFPRHLLSDSIFRRGFAELGAADLTFDAWMFYDQLPELADLAARFEDTRMVVDHFGGPIAPPSPEGRAEVFDIWSKNVADLAKRPNVFMKLGGAGMPRYHYGHDVTGRATSATAEELVEAWGPYIETCIAHFGPPRCMFESNFPPDRETASYPTLWNAFKLAARGYTAAEKDMLFAGSASDFYRL